MIEFEDIEVTGFDDENWEQCLEYPSMRYIPVKLSRTPPREWINLWEGCRASFSRGIRRRTKTSKGIIFLHAGTDGIDDFQAHLEVMRSRAKATNREYRNKQELAYREEQTKLEQEKEREKQDDELKEKLRSQGLIG